MHEVFEILDPYFRKNGIRIQQDHRNENDVFYGFITTPKNFAIEGRLRVKNGHIIVDKTQYSEVEFNLYEPNSLNRLVVHLWRMHNLPVYDPAIHG
jgi:hypothetical protein